MDFLEIEDPQRICNYSVHGVKTNKFGIYNEEIVLFSSYFADYI